MKRLLGLVEEFRSAAGEVEQLIVQEGREVSLTRAATGGTDLFLSTLLRERNERVGNGSATGEGVFDFRYGPFTGGLGETGVLHLATYGEKILGVEIDLSVKHRRIEAGLRGTSPHLALRGAERVCGNFGFTHAHSLALAVEKVLGIGLSERERRLAVVALELERVYNHLHVIKRLAEAAAQKVLAAHLGALFERALRVNRGLSGSRYLLGVRRIGSLAVEPQLSGDSILRELAEVGNEFEALFTSSLSSRNYLDRLHNIAVVSGTHARTRSLTGPSLRACGIEDDLRQDDPLYPGFAPTTRSEGDSLARMEVRAEEILSSLAIIQAQREVLNPIMPRERESSSNGSEDQKASSHSEREQGSGTAVGAAEGPSGVVAWAVELESGSVRRAYVSTPSLFGYQVFAESLTGHIFTDFPFALDSFGLSFADAAR